MLVRTARREAGFTLIEIAVVLVIIGLLLGSFINTFAQRIDTTRRDNTKKELEEIKSVIMAYAYTKSPPYIPCPDTDSPLDGIENRSGASCTSAHGFVPWVTLGVGYSDAWGNRYRYWVRPDYSDSSGFSLTTADDSAKDARVFTRVQHTVQDLIDNAVVVIFSQGKNGLGARSFEGTDRAPVPAVGGGHDDERENLDLDISFVSRDLRVEGATTVNGGIFDDIVIWIGALELKAKMVEAGVL